MSWYCNNLISKFVPLHKQTPKNNKSIWMNKLTLSKSKMKNRAYHRFLKTKDQYDYQMSAKYRNQSKNACRKAVTDYEKSLSKEVKSNPKAFFKSAFTEESDCLSDFNLNFPAEENLVIFRHPPPPSPPLYVFKQQNDIIKTIDVCFCLGPFSPPKSVHTFWMVPIRVSDLGLFQF